MNTKIRCKNCNYKGEAKTLFETTSPTPFCPSCGTSDVEVLNG